MMILILKKSISETVFIENCRPSFYRHILTELRLYLHVKIHHTCTWKIRVYLEDQGLPDPKKVINRAI